MKGIQSYSIIHIFARREDCETKMVAYAKMADTYTYMCHVSNIFGTRTINA